MQCKRILYIQGDVKFYNMFEISVYIFQTDVPRHNEALLEYIRSLLVVFYGIFDIEWMI